METQTASPMTLNGKRIVVLGGTSGIGFATAAIVVASSRRESVDRAVARLPKGTEGYALDLLKEEHVRDFFTHLGACDHLAFTAGEMLQRSELSKTNVEQARHAFDLRFWGAFMAAKYGSSQIRPGGSIVLTSGTAGRRPHKGGTVGATILGAVEALTRALAVELAPIRVNAVCPGPVRTEMWMSLPEEDREATFRGIGQALPVGRVGEAHDLAHAYLFLMREGCEHRFGEKGKHHIIQAKTGCSCAKNSLSLLVSVLGETVPHEPPELTTAACNSSREALGFSNDQWLCCSRFGASVQV